MSPDGWTMWDCSGALIGAVNKRRLRLGGRIPLSVRSPVSMETPWRHHTRNTINPQNRRSAELACDSTCIVKSLKSYYFLVWGRFYLSLACKKVFVLCFISWFELLSALCEFQDCCQGYSHQDKNLMYYVCKSAVSKKEIVLAKSRKTTGGYQVNWFLMSEMYASP